MRAFMDDTTYLVIATRNPGKTAEIRELLKGFPLQIGNIEEFGPIPEVEEDGQTFEENAYKKASFTARILGLPDNNLRIIRPYIAGGSLLLALSILFLFNPPAGIRNARRGADMKAGCQRVGEHAGLLFGFTDDQDAFTILRFGFFH